MKKPTLIANWKNAPGSWSEASALLRSLGQKRLLYKRLNLFIAPPLPYLYLVGEKASGYSKLATQDLFPEERGRYTGKVGLDILKSFGVRMAILGHSESRALGESSAQVSRKTQVALKAGLTPVVCFGELTRDRDGEHFDFLREELKASLHGLKKNDLSKIFLAYEPVWAIGQTAKEALDPLGLSEIVVFVKKVLTDLFGRDAADRIALLYGGSVEASNAGVLLKNSGISGFLVGHKSLIGKDFEKIARSMLEK